jgi:hypothetical protein
VYRADAERRVHLVSGQGEVVDVPRIVDRALAAEATSIYVSAAPTGSAVGFYLNQGCQLADPVHPALFAKEPEDRSPHSKLKDHISCLYEKDIDGDCKQRKQKRRQQSNQLFFFKTVS